LKTEYPTNFSKFSFDLATQIKTKRLSKSDDYYERSKYIARPNETIEAGNHRVWESVGFKFGKKNQ